MSAGPPFMPSSAPRFSRIRRFRAHFIDCLALALAAYPEARISVSDQYVTLHPSRPAIAKL